MATIPRTHEDIEAQIRDIQSRKKELVEEVNEKDRVGLGESGYYDRDIYDGGGSKFEGYVTSIAANDEVEDEDYDVVPFNQNKRPGYTAPAALLNDVAQVKQPYNTTPYSCFMRETNTPVQSKLPDNVRSKVRILATNQPSTSFNNRLPQSEKDYDPFAERRRPTIAEKEDEYRQKRRRMVISPERVDPFAQGGKTPDFGSRTYTEIMKEQLLHGEETELRKKLVEKSKEGTLKAVSNGDIGKTSSAPKRKGRWDQTTGEETPTSTPTPAKKKTSNSTWEKEDATPSSTRWDETPGHGKGGETPGATPGQSTRMWEATPGHATPGHATPGRETTPSHDKSSSRRNRWDETPKTERETPGHNSGWAETPRTDRTGAGGDLIQETPTPSASKRRSRWDETPGSQMTPGAMTPTTPGTPHTPHGTPHTPHGTPSILTPSGVTPTGTKAMAMATPTPGHLATMTPEQLQAYRWEREIDERNRPLSDDELDSYFPVGYKVLQPPAGYIPIRTPARKLTATPTPMVGTPAGFFIQTEDKSAKFMDNQPKGNLPFMKPEDAQYFDKLLVDVDEETLSPEEQKERKIMKLLLKIKNGTPPMRKAALRQITDKAREFGAGPLFNQILPLLMSPTLEDQERHLLVKVIDRILYKLDDLVRPYVHKILVVIEPLLIDEDYYARVEGREIISNLAKAAGLATMISTMRPDIDNIDEYVRNTTARAFAVVASALGIPSLLPFLKAVCRSKKSWQARHTGIKIVQQIAILMGCAILPHLKSLVEIIEHGECDYRAR
uniref:Splicing factor 3B subunit 1 domain-containing protein n=1 Tax=Timema shepardi TaxID=629360 RepID=A0A7R9B6I0_TIMSH|nr:unnamed protein product [Timema shepardi]